MARAKQEPGEKILAKNRRATFDYELDAHYEAGMSLLGSEVKSMRAGAVSLVDAWAAIENDGVYLKNVTVEPLPHAAFAHAPRRARKLLLHAGEIEEIRKHVEQGGKTLIPLRIYLKDGLIKTELAIARGKRKEDKRESIKQREANREAQAAMRRAHRG